MSRTFDLIRKRTMSERLLDILDQCPGGIPSEELAGRLYDGRALPSDPDNNLKVQISYTNRKLAEHGLRIVCSRGSGPCPEGQAEARYELIRVEGA